MRGVGKRFQAQKKIKINNNSKNSKKINSFVRTRGRRIFGKFYTILHFFIENWKIGLDFSRKGGKSLASESHDERGLARDGGVGHGKIVGQLSLGEVKLLIFSRNVFLVLEDGLDVVEGGVVLDVEGDVLDYLHANFLLHASLLLRLRLLLHLLPPGTGEHNIEQ